MRQEKLKAAFEKSGVRLVFPEVMSGRTQDTEAFQMTIRKERGKEYFAMWPGASVNQIHIIDADPKKQQVILYVKEPARTIEVRVGFDQRKRKPIMETQKIEEDTRKYLMGMDESHLFIAQLPKEEFSGAINTVDGAHKVLKPADLPMGKGKSVKKYKVRKSVIRQGEWFFSPATTREQARVAQHLRKHGKLGVMINHPLGDSSRRGENPHVATEVIEFPGVSVFARGTVKHPDHKTITLPGWHRVWLNREVRPEPGRIAGVYGWID